RFLRLHSHKQNESSQSQLAGAPPHLEFLRGRTYDIELFSYQPQGVAAPERFVVCSDGSSVQVIGRHGFDVASRYDRVRVAVQAQLPANGGAVQTLVVVEPGPSVQGPTIQLPVLVRERPGVRPASVAAAVLSLGLLVGVSVVSASGLKAAFLAIGLLLAFVLQSYGRPIASLAGPAVSGIARRPSPPTVVVEPPQPHGQPTVGAQT